MTMKAVIFIMLMVLLLWGYAAPVGPVEQYEVDYGHIGDDTDGSGLQEYSEDQNNGNYLFKFWWE